MPRYYFDTRDDDDFIKDDIGVELSDLEAVKEQAAVSLAELALEVIPGVLKRTMIVEARDEEKAVLEARLVFEAIVVAD